jgi:outer membrane protein assembly factor BamB
MSSPGGAEGRDIRALASHRDQLVATSLTGPIRAYDVRCRRQRWEFDDGPTDAVALRVRVHGDRLYVPYSDGSIVALDLQTGVERWRTNDSRQSFDWPPATSATSIFVSAAEALWAFHLHPLETAPLPELGDDDH